MCICSYILNLLLCSADLIHLYTCPNWLSETDPERYVYSTDSENQSGHSLVSWSSDSRSCFSVTARR